MTVSSDPHLIAQQYERFPYPSPAEQGKSYPELANLLKLFELDCGYRLENKRILDAGTGTGLRLLELAKSFPENEYIGVDLSANAIRVANEMRQSTCSVGNLPFSAIDLHDLNSDEQGTFDLIVCMGVLHHLEFPAEMLRILNRLLKPDGALFLYVYGQYGSSLRMQRKRILHHLCGNEPVEQKIAMAKIMGFTDFPYGWELRNERDMDAMLLDAYINEYEQLYTLERIADMLLSAGYSSWVPYGFALEKNGVLVESRVSYRRRIPLNSTTPKSWLTSESLQQIYEVLPKRRQFLLLEEWYHPSAYTVLIHKEGFLRQVDSPERLLENTWQ